MRKYLGLVTLVATLLLMAWTASEPRELRADVSRPVLAGDSVRFVVSFTPPAGLDSVSIRWTLGTATQYHTLTPPVASVDTVKFGGLAPGYSATGSVQIRCWKDGLSSNGVTRSYSVVIPAPNPPADVSGVAFVDSAVVY